MSKGYKNSNTSQKVGKDKSNDISNRLKDNANGYLFQMSHAPVLEETAHWFQMIPAIVFTAVVIMITMMYSYERPMSQFFWSINESAIADFFSYYKMIAILICAVLSLVILLYRVFTQSFYIKRSFAYIPMAVYTIFVLASYLFSDYKEFALWGFNDRFEGTVALLCYMVMLFYIINTINSEKNVKTIIYSLAAGSTILGLLGISQGLGHDFFRTTIGKKLITPSGFWDNIDSLDFTFKNEIYQTVYNINYVSFYLTLLLPIFGLLFIRSMTLGKNEPLYKKLIWGVVFALLLYNLIGSASSGGLLGMAFVVLIAIIVLNKRILEWWKPLTILIIITLILGGLSYDKWLPEFKNAINNFDETQTEKKIESNNIQHKIDYMETVGNDVILGYNGEKVIFTIDPNDPSSLLLADSNGAALTLVQIKEDPPTFQFEDERYNWITVRPAKDEKENHYIILSTDGHDWPFMITKNGPKYFSDIKKLVDLRKVPAVGWENNQSFGTGRGYIWSRTIPLMKNTLIIGHGADTFCIFFPQDDYIGKYNSGSFSSNINVVVDKPHDLYLGYFIGTGGISVLALLILWFSYIVQSFRLYFYKIRSEEFLAYVGTGIFLGICGFLVAAFVNDSSVSVTPMFYGLLGTGIAINMMLKNKVSNENHS